jgi:F0F1-type ATP synthase delta subunit
MKYRSSIYAKALAEVISSKTTVSDASVVRNFLAMVERNGDGAHLKAILEEAARFARGKNGVRKVILESARPLNDAQRKAVGTFARRGDVVEETINPALVAGVRIVVDDERQFDWSLKGKLDKLFGN